MNKGGIISLERIPLDGKVRNWISQKFSFPHVRDTLISKMQQFLPSWYAVIVVVNFIIDATQRTSWNIKMFLCIQIPSLFPNFPLYHSS